MSLLARPQESQFSGNWKEFYKKHPEHPRFVEIDYTNRHGDRYMFKILPQSIDFTSNEWHPEPQWILTAVNLETQMLRGYAIARIHNWNQFSLQAKDQSDYVVDKPANQAE